PSPDLRASPVPTHCRARMPVPSWACVPEPHRTTRVTALESENRTGVLRVERHERICADMCALTHGPERRSGASFCTATMSADRKYGVLASQTHLPCSARR